MAGTDAESKLARAQWLDNPPTSLQECLFIPGALFFFTKFLTQERSEENIELWHAVNMYLKKAEAMDAGAQAVSPAQRSYNINSPAAANRNFLELKRIEEEGKALEQELAQDAVAIVHKFIGVTAPRQVNISDKLERAIVDDMAIPDTKKRVAALKESLGACKTEIFALLSRDPFPRFTRSELWKEFLQGGQQVEVPETPTAAPVFDDSASLFPLHLSYDEKYKDPTTASSGMAAILALASEDSSVSEADFSALVLPKKGPPLKVRGTVFPTSSSSPAISSAIPSKKVSIKTASCGACGCVNAASGLCVVCHHVHTERPIVGPSPGPNFPHAVTSSPVKPLGKTLATGPPPVNHYATQGPAVKRGPPQRYSNMTLDFQAVLDRATADAKEISLFKDFSTKLLKVEQHYCQKLENLLGDEHKKLGKALTEDGTGLVNGMCLKKLWAEVGTVLSERIRLSGKAFDSITETVVNPLVAAEKQSATTLKTVAAAVKKAEAELRKAVETLNKSKDECLKTLQSLQSLQDKERAERVEPKKVALQGQIKPLLVKATEQMQSVIPKIEEANKQQSGFVSGLGGHLDTLQELDEKRVSTLTSAVAHWLTFQRQRDMGMGASGDPLLTRIQNEPDQTIQTGISDWLFDYGNKVSPEAFIYDLPLRPVDIVEGYVPGGHVDWMGASSVTLNLNFGVPIPTILKREKTEGKEAPLLVYTLCDAIRTTGGLEVEGLFRPRPSDSKSEYARLRLTEMEQDNVIQIQRQFDSGNMSLKPLGGDPHLAAALLRSWLMQLPEPLIPRSLFNDCVNQMQQAKLVRQNAGSQKPVGDDCVLALFGKLPPHSQAVISLLAGLVKDIVANSSKNHTTFDAVAGHFAGGYLTGARTRSDDALEALQQLRLEKCFLICLFTALCRR